MQDTMATYSIAEGTRLEEDTIGINNVSAIQCTLMASITDWQDVPRLRMHLSAALASLQKHYRATLTLNAKTWLLKYFMEAIERNQSNVTALRQSFRAIVPHMYGSHEFCGYQCGFVSTHEGYRINKPHGQDLDDEFLREDLEEIFALFEKNAHRIAPLRIKPLNNSGACGKTDPQHFPGEMKNCESDEDLHTIIVGTVNRLKPCASSTPYRVGSVTARTRLKLSPPADSSDIPHDDLDDFFASYQLNTENSMSNSTELMLDGHENHAKDAKVHHDHSLDFPNDDFDEIMASYDLDTSITEDSFSFNERRVLLAPSVLPAKQETDAADAEAPSGEIINLRPENLNNTTSTSNGTGGHASCKRSVKKLYDLNNVCTPRMKIPGLDPAENMTRPAINKGQEHGTFNTLCNHSVHQPMLGATVSLQNCESTKKIDSLTTEVVKAPRSTSELSMVPGPSHAVAINDVAPSHTVTIRDLAPSHTFTVSDVEAATHSGCVQTTIHTTAVEPPRQSYSKVVEKPAPTHSILNVTERTETRQDFNDLSTAYPGTTVRQANDTNNAGHRHDNGPISLQEHSYILPSADMQTCDQSKNNLTTFKTANETIIPPHQVAPSLNKIFPDVYTPVVFDLETTAFGPNADIIQISAVDEEHVFNCYTTPTKPIDEQATAVTGLSSVGNTLFHNGEPVESVPLTAGLHMFVDWLDQRAPPVVLIGHNARKFDCYMLIPALADRKLLTKFSQLVIGFVDTLPLYKELCPDARSYRRESLVSLLLHTTYETHNGLIDAKALQQLLAHSKVPKCVLFGHSFSTESFLQVMQFEAASKENTQSLGNLVLRKALSDTMAKRIGQSGLQFNHIASEFCRFGKEGIERLFTEEHEGKPRVTRSKSVINKLCLHLELMLNNEKNDSRVQRHDATVTEEQE